MPDRLLVEITPSECIGCSKCIPACPVDAIIGAQGQMHTVISEFCIGCALCVKACPVDCITFTTSANHQPIVAKMRNNAQKLRLSKEIAQKASADHHAQSVDMKLAISQAIARAKQKK